MAGDETMLAAWPLPVTDDPIDAGFWAAARRGQLVVQGCAECGHRVIPPRPMCPRCQSISVRWVPTSGRATIWSFIVAHPPLLPAYAELAPYNAIVVALEEDPFIRFVGNLVASERGEINEIDPETITIGEPVRVVFPTVDDIALPRWIRADS